VVLTDLHLPGISRIDATREITSELPDVTVPALAAERFNSTVIGRKLFLSPETVDSYRSRAMRKLGLGSRPDVVRFAVRSGLLSAG
jgi:DNA-binding NarL/FixJ family response regulator